MACATKQFVLTNPRQFEPAIARVCELRYSARRRSPPGAWGSIAVCRTYYLLVRVSRGRIPTDADSPNLAEWVSAVRATPGSDPREPHNVHDAPEHVDFDML